jgi:uncharacterized protein (TIGR02246 family)
MKTRPVIALLAFLLSLTMQPLLATKPGDVAAIRDLQTKQALAWNQHDAGAYANLFTENGDVVNVLGWWWRGREQIRSKLTEAFVWVFRDSELFIEEVNVRFLDRATAIAHVRWRMRGAKTPPGAAAAPQQGIQLQVLRKLGGQWLIESFQNTNSMPESPFPSGPPPSQ